MHPLFAQVANRVIEMGRFASEKGWTVATGGNFSARLDHDMIAITATGTDKGNLSPLDILEGHLQKPYPARSSAETPIHFGLYQASPDIGAVFHVHSPYALLLSMEDTILHQGFIPLKGYELLKAIRGVKTHDTQVQIPVIPNTQDMDAVHKQIPELMKKGSAPAFILAGHGLTTWGSNPAEAMRHGEALEFLFKLEWKRKTQS